MQPAKYRLFNIFQPITLPDLQAYLVVPVLQQVLRPLDKILGGFSGWQANYPFRVFSYPLQKPTCSNQAQLREVVNSQVRDLVLIFSTPDSLRKAASVFDKG